MQYAYNINMMYPTVKKPKQIKKKNGLTGYYSHLMCFGRQRFSSCKMLPAWLWLVYICKYMFASEIIGHT